MLSAHSRRLRVISAHCGLVAHQQCQPSAPPARENLFPSVCFQRQSAVTGLASIDVSALDHFRREGFLVCRHAFPLPKVAAALEAMMEMVSGTHAAFATAVKQAGASPQTGTVQADRMLYERRFPERQLEPGVASLPEADQKNPWFVRKLSGFIESDQRCLALAQSQALLAAVQVLLGSGGDGGDVQLFQDMALLKPRRGTEKPWHQDMAYFNADVSTSIVGCWIALADCWPENACMRVLPRGHRIRNAGGFDEPHCRPHFNRRDWQLCDDDVASFVSQAVAVPLRAGDLLFFDGLIPHGEY